MNEKFNEPAIVRLRKFLETNNQPNQIEVLTPDASTREYFRISRANRTAIACVYGESFKAAEHSYLDVTSLFLANELPVAEVYQFDETLGIVIQEDFGDVILRDELHQNKDELYNQAISLIARIQAVTDKAYQVNSIASRLSFDTEKLLWELNYFKTHYFETFKKETLSTEDDAVLTEEFTELSIELSNRAKVLCHRDFHAANLMIDGQNHLRIIDHQDARIGAASYDLVSLLLDRVMDIPDVDWLAEKKRFFLSEREKLDLEKIDFEEFDAEFQLQTVQRCLKAVGTFSFQSINRGKIYFIPYIQPMLKIVLQAVRKLERFPHLQKIIERETYENTEP